MKRRYIIVSFIAIFIFSVNNLLSQAPSDSSASAKVKQDSIVVKTSEKVEKVVDKITGTIQKSRPTFQISFGKIFWTVVLILLGLFAMRFLTRLLESIAERWTNLRLAIKGAIPIIRIFGWTLIIYFIIADIFSPPIETLIAFTASAGIAIGFASQDILKNIFGGIMILFDRPFQVGDKIEIGSYYGEVVRIGLRTVRVVTADDSLVSIPNSEIVNQSVSNANAGESNCQVVAEFYLPPDIDLVKSKKIAYQAAAISRYVFLNKPIAIIFKNEIHQGRSLLKMRLKAYVLDIRYEFPFMSEMTEIVMTEFLKHGLVNAEQLAMIRAQN
ncbi:MAG TPA: mechanosensitive ion channel domain-containing protein [bacterium]